MEPLIKRNFRYTFPRQTLCNFLGFMQGCHDSVATLAMGLYTFSYRDRVLVLQVDAFGEVRLANETPVNNPTRLAKALIRSTKQHKN